MKALTVWQPWASLIMIGAKPFEFRSRHYREYVNAPSQGDEIAIHAGARKVKLTEVHDLLLSLRRSSESTALIEDKAAPLLERVMAAPIGQAVVPLGHLLGTVRLGEAKRSCDLFNIDVADSERTQFNFGWRLDEPRLFDRPIEMRGAQGFWSVSDELVREALS